MLGDDDLSAIRARVNAATPGPWVLRHDEPSMSGRHWSIRRHGVPGVRIQAHEYGDGSDGEFIAHAREDVPALLDEVTYWKNTSKAQERALKRWQSLAEKAEADSPEDLRAALDEHLGQP